MKKLLTFAIGAASLAAVPALAAPTINVSFGGASGSFSNNTVFCGASGGPVGNPGDGGGTSTWSTSGASAPCNFTDTMTFMAPVGYTLVGGSITTSTLSGQVGTVDDINFSSVMLNGSVFSLFFTGAAFEVGNITNIPLILNPGLNTLVVKGQTRGTGVSQGGVTEAGSYAGQLTFAISNPVPEPATWLSMIAGFAMLGFAMRRTSAKRRVNFTFA